MSSRVAFRCRDFVCRGRRVPSSACRVGTPCPRVLVPYSQLVWSGDVMVGTGVPTLRLQPCDELARLHNAAINSESFLGHGSHAP